MPVPITAAELRQMADSFPWDEYSETLADGLHKAERDILNAAGADAARRAGGMWKNDNPFAVDFMTSYVGERITSLDDASRDAVVSLLRGVYDDAAENVSVAELSSRVFNAVKDQYENYEGYRANRIARSETAIVSNHGKVLGYSGAGVEDVEVLDGSEFDEECAQANGQTWSLDEALSNPIEHPNCERDFAPVVPKDDESRRLGIERHEAREWQAIGASSAIVTADIWSRVDPHHPAGEVDELDETLCYE